MKYLGIDYGTKRVGTALSDQTGTLARPFTMVNNDENLLHELLKIIKDNQVSAVVLGLPKNMNNSLGPSAELVMDLKVSLEEHEIKVYLQDERRTTTTAEELLIAKDTRRLDRKAKIDNLAAAIILQTYLDSC